MMKNLVLVLIVFFFIVLVFNVVVFEKGDIFVWGGFVMVVFDELFLNINVGDDLGFGLIIDNNM